jgi:hypothetical protein
MFRKLFENWEQQILRPIINSLLTALLLLASSLLFKPVRTFLFPSPEVKEYPLHCTAEPYLDPSGKRLLVDFFIINRTGKDYSREDLESILRANNPDPSAALSPDIVLKYSNLVNGRPIGSIEEVLEDADFNRDKGEIVLDHRADLASLRINSIAERAVMKVTLRIVGLPDLQNSGVSRMAKNLVPVDFRPYEAGCYTRK